MTIDSPMLIVCSNCATSYEVEPSTLGPTGRSVRCARCQNVWFVSNTDAMAAIALSHHQDIAAFSTARQDQMAETSSPAYDPTANPTANVPSETPPELLSDLPPSAMPDRDDRGPAARPDPQSVTPPPEPVVVSDAPALAPGDPERTLQATDAIPENIESVAARRVRRPPARRKRQPVAPIWSITILAMLAINIGLIGWRTDIVRALPQTASFYAMIGLEVNLRGLTFGDLVTRKEAQDGVTMLVVEGVIKSTSKRPVDVPRLRFAVRNAKGHDIYSWTALPTQSVIAPGAAMPFRSRLASPPRDAHTLLVRFFNRRDLVAGVK